MGMSYLELTHSLADAFNTLADEAQGLNDRRIVLEHKLRFAHEQLQYLADKYAAATPEITETLAKLQLPPHTSIDNTSPVPLPSRGSARSQHEIALVIRDGCHVASKLASLGDVSKTTGSTRDTDSPTSHEGSSTSTALEQDFTVEGKRGNLQCPFSKRSELDGATGNEEDGEPAPLDSTPHQSADPICAAMYEESTSQAPPASATGGGKCPIRYMDQHSPEEIAHYVETHKHELPRSHEICLRRYQYNEQQIKKLDSKYGNTVSMIEDLGQLHQPMLPEAEQEQERPHRQSEVDKASNERVQNWAKAVTVTTDDAEVVENAAANDGHRQSHFDRPLQEVRVGESPSRPWGIHVPIYEASGREDEHPLSPPPAPVRVPSPAHSARTPVKDGRKCPFDHSKVQGFAGGAFTGGLASTPKPDDKSPIGHQPSQEASFSPPKEQAPAQSSHLDGPAFPTQSPHLDQPAFINPDSVKGSAGGTPQMVFTGPVFIGYPIDQALQIINQYRPNNS